MELRTENIPCRWTKKEVQTIKKAVRLYNRGKSPLERTNFSDWTRKYSLESAIILISQAEKE